MSVKINSFELENVKRVKAVQLTPSENGLTVIGGRNGQGKTSVLDAIAWALGGEKFRPSNPGRAGSALPPALRVTLSNGIVVERKGKNSALKVMDPSGSRRGQQLLDEFVEKLALDLPRFMAAGDREKADTLLNIIGVGPELQQLEQEEKALYQERLAVGRVADQKNKYAAELPAFDGVPGEIVSASELIRRQQAILAQNGENARKRARRDDIAGALERQEAEVRRLSALLDEAETRAHQLQNDLDIAEKDALQLHDESTEALERDIAQIDEINAKVRANLERAKALEDAKQYTEQYNRLTGQIDEVRAKRRALLDGASLPLPGLSVEDGALRYNGQAWDCMSGAEQLRVAAAIVRRLNPECGFILMDKLEQMDGETLREFGAWLEAERLQVIATRVSSSGEACTILIEDGAAVAGAPEMESKPKFSMGVF